MRLNPLLPALALAGLIATTLRASAPSAANAAWESAEFHAVVTGTSTLHGWNVETRQASGGISLAPASGRLAIPAKSLHGAQSGLNERMFAALKADAHPMIVFEGAELQLPATFDAAVEVPIRGRLTIAGTTRELTLTCRVAAPAERQVAIETEAALKLTDFGIKPPTFMGMIRTGDAIVVKVRWLLRASATPAAGKGIAAQ